MPLHISADYYAMLQSHRSHYYTTPPTYHTNMNVIRHRHIRYYYADFRHDSCYCCFRCATLCLLPSLPPPVIRAHALHYYIYRCHAIIAAQRYATVIAFAIRADYDTVVVVASYDTHHDVTRAMLADFRALRHMQYALLTLRHTTLSPHSVAMSPSLATQRASATPRMLYAPAMIAFSTR